LATILSLDVHQRLLYDGTKNLGDRGTKRVRLQVTKCTKPVQLCVGFVIVPFFLAIRYKEWLTMYKNYNGFDLCFAKKHCWRMTGEHFFLVLSLSPKLDARLFFLVLLIYWHLDPLTGMKGYIFMNRIFG
jgi:hypothetical protein